MFCMLKIKKYIAYVMKLKSWKTTHTFSDWKWRRIASSHSKKLSALLRGITSKHHSDFYCLNCIHSFAAENKYESHKKVCENKDFCDIVMPSEDTKILGFNQYKKSDKTPFIIYADLECLIGKIDECKNNLENSSTTKVGEHIPSGFAFKSIENKHDVTEVKIVWIGF